MRELISIIINSLSALENDGKITIMKRSDSEYVISGRGVEGDIPYKYNIDISFSVLTAADDDGDDGLEKIREAVRKEVERMKAENMMHTMSKYADQSPQGQDGILNEDDNKLAG